MDEEEKRRGREEEKKKKKKKPGDLKGGVCLLILALFVYAVLLPTSSDCL